MTGILNPGFKYLEDASLQTKKALGLGCHYPGCCIVGRKRGSLDTSSVRATIYVTFDLGWRPTLESLYGTRTGNVKGKQLELKEDERVAYNLRIASAVQNIRRGFEVILG